MIKNIFITFSLLIGIFVFISCKQQNKKDYTSENWTQYKGPNRNGKIDSEYFKNSIDILWQYNYVGGEPTPLIVYNDTIYFGTLSGNVYSIKEDGKLNWKINIQGKITNSLAYYNNTIIAVTNSAVVFGIDATNGKIKWKYNFENIKNIDSKYNIFYPIIDNDKVYITCFDEIAVLKAETGKLINTIQYKVGNHFDTPPLITKDAIYIKASYPIAFDKISGKLKWQGEKLYSTYFNCTSAPYSYKNNIFFSKKFSIKGYDKNTGKNGKTIYVNLQNNLGIIENDKLYYAYTDHYHFSSSSRICCENLISNEAIFCRVQSGLSMSRSTISDIIMVGNYIYYHRNNNEIYCTNKVNGDKIYSKILPSEKLSGMITYSNGKLYITSNEIKSKNGHNTIFVLK